MGDFQADTMSLSMMEQGAYDRLLDYYYATEKPIPADADRAAIICRAVTEPERAAVDFVLGAYFVREHDGWHNARADREIAAAGSARVNGRAGGRPRKTGIETVIETERETGPETEGGTEIRTGSGHPPTTNHQPKENPLSPGFARFWLAWPKNDRKASKGECAKRWAARGYEDQTDRILAHIARMKSSRDWTKNDGEFIPAPMTYLNQRRWEADDVMPRDEFQGVV